jgi:hypothetical protein
MTKSPNTTLLIALLGCAGCEVLPDHRFDDRPRDANLDAPADAPAPTDSRPDAPPDGPAARATLTLTVTGSCAQAYADGFVTFTGDLVVLQSSGGGIAIVGLPSPLARLTFDLHSSSGTLPLSTAQAMMTGDVVSLEAAGQTWRNQSDDVVDPITGEVEITDYAANLGRSELMLQGVTIQDGTSDTLCVLDGTVVTRSFTP